MSNLKYYKPTSPSRRHSSVVDYNSILTKSKPHKKLLVRQANTGGRNNSGKITIRHRGGGSRKLIRLIDFKRNFPQGFKVLSIEYDPNRTAFICLVTDLFSGKKKYILHTKAMKVGQKYDTGAEQELKEGNKLQLKNIPVGTVISQIQLDPNRPAVIVRSAGSSAQVTAKEEKYTTVKLPSGEIRKVLSECSCVVGRVGNDSHELVRLGSAGRKRRKGIRPTVRGKVMNPVDHPHGGGEGRNPIGLKYPKTPWGKHALGVRTRRKKSSDKLIVNRKKKR